MNFAEILFKLRLQKKMNNICSDISKNLIEESKEVKYLEGS